MYEYLNALNVCGISVVYRGMLLTPCTCCNGILWSNGKGYHFSSSVDPTEIEIVALTQMEILELKATE